MMRSALLAAFLAASSVAAGLLPSLSPSVDLGYASPSAAYNALGDFYKFSNIRYADPPKRFQRASPPSSASLAASSNTSVYTCPQAYPWWLLEGLAPQYLMTTDQLAAYLYSTAVSEDCLFLDVSVPQTIYNNKTKSKGAAVMVWIYGGGFTLGSKDTNDESGLVTQSKSDGQDGVIFVKLNYRLGAFGWMAAGDGITPNLGLWDQRLALEWVQKYIHLFGGDPNRVTVMGESAGGASIMHHITACGGTCAPLFQQAIPQSAAFAIAPNNEYGYETALEAASNITGTSITSVAQLQALDSQTMIAVNKAVVNASSQGTFTYGPAIDGTYVPDLPGVLLKQGKFNRSINVMPGHNSEESADFAGSISSDAEFAAAVGNVLYGVPDATVTHVTEVLYPDDLSGAQNYTDETGRLQLFVAEEAFTCNTRYLAEAYGGKTWSYLFSYPPGHHQQDVDFTFFAGDVLQSEIPGTVVDAALATAMQRYFTRFAQKGNPNGGALQPTWPRYGDNATLLNFGLGGIDTVPDTNANPRCDYWGSGQWRG